MDGSGGSLGLPVGDAPSADLLRALFDEATDAILLTDPAGRIVTANPSATALTGRAAAALAGGALRDLLAPPEPGTAPPPAEESCRAGRTEARVLRREDGELVDVEVWCRALPGGLQLWHLRDATELRRREVDAWIRGEAIESSSQAIALASVQGRVSYVNRAFLRLWGLESKAEAVGRATSSFWAFPERAQAAFHAALERGGGDGELVGVRRNGERFPAEFSTSLVCDVTGRPVAAMVSFVDTTARLRTLEALRESEERLRQAVRVADIGVFDNDLRLGVLHWSARQREIFDIDRDERVTMAKMLERVHPEDRAAVRETILASEAPGSDGRYDVDCRVIRRDGAVRFVSVRARTFFEGEGEARHPVRRLGASRDVTESTLASTERERLRAQLEHAQRLESVGRLAGGVAHDFNNMLAVILGNAELIRSRPGIDPAVLTDLADIERSARQARDVTRQLLAFSRRQVVAPQALDLNEVLERSRRTLARLIGEDVEMAFDPAPGLWRVSLDPLQLDQILMNLAVNARDAMPGGGRLTIATANVQLDEATRRQHAGLRPGDHVLLTVSDSGAGMDQETLRHVFEPFFTTKGPGQGTGLGLATVHGIVTQSGGAIHVDSEPGHGSTFEVYLPRLRAAGGEVPRAEEAVSVHGGGNILLVEDNEMVRRVTAAMLRALGLTVLTCSGSSEALEVAGRQEQHIDLVLTDVVMPGMGGKGLRDQLRLLRPGLPVLLMSGYAPDVFVRQGVLDEGEVLLQKPFSLNDLARAVRDGLRAPALDR